MGERLKGKVAIVTGATSGIGRGIASAFVSEGARVLFTGRDLERGGEVERQLGKDSCFRAVDVAEEAEVKAMVDAAIERFGRVDCLVNNAGEGYMAGGVMDLDTEKFWKSFDVLVGSVIYGMKYAAPEIAKVGGGSIVNISSIAGGGVGFSGYTYSAAKAAVIHLSKYAAMELAPRRVRVNIISPGPILTAIFTRTRGGSVADAEKRMGKLAEVFEELTPLHLAGTPDDIAMGCLYLAGEESRYVTGQDLAIDGGILNSRPVEDVTAMWAKIRAAATG